LLLGACLAGSYRFAARRFDPAAQFANGCVAGAQILLEPADEHGLALGVDFELLDAPVCDCRLRPRGFAPRRRSSTSSFSSARARFVAGGDLPLEIGDSVPGAG